MENVKKILELKDITKVFPGVKALDKVHLEIYPGEVHALCGENGAGKSTLMKIISGAERYTSGTIVFDDQNVAFSSTREAEKHGITMIYQEFNLIPHLSVAENIFLGRYPKTKSGIVNWKKMNEMAIGLLDKVGLKLNPKKIVNNCSVGEMQMVEIAKCLSMDSRVIIMDEPTAALTDEEVECLFGIIDSLKEHNISIIYISHRMKEIVRISDRVTVFRDGKYIKSMKVEDTDKDEIVRLMVGRDLKDLFPKRKEILNREPSFEAKNISYKKLVNNVSLQLAKGEILGIAGLMGSGNVVLAKLLCGYYGKYSGEVLIDNKKVNIFKPNEAIQNGMFLVSDDRKNEGLVLQRSVKENISLASLDSITKNNLISKKIELEKTMKQIELLQIKVSSPEQIVGLLSGGNQQKVVFAKMLETKPRIIFLAEPTRGIDIGAKAEIYQIMNKLTDQGISIVLISSDLPELVGMSDRVIVMREGQVRGEIAREDLSQELVLSYATGGGGKNVNN